MLPASAEMFVDCEFLRIVSSRTKGRTKIGFLRTFFQGPKDELTVDFLTRPKDKLNEDFYE